MSNNKVTASALQEVMQAAKDYMDSEFLCFEDRVDVENPDFDPGFEDITSCECGIIEDTAVDEIITKYFKIPDS